MFRSLFFVVILSIIVVLTGCGSRSGDRQSDTRIGKVKILSSGNMAVVKDSRLKHFSSGDTIAVMKADNILYWGLSNVDSKTDSVFKMSTTSDAQVVQIRIAVLLNFEEPEKSKE